MNGAMHSIACAAGLDTLVRPVVLVFDPVTVSPRSPALEAAIAKAESAWVGARVDPGSDPLAPVVAAVRGLYRRVGLDPTKTRPSSEALRRRVRRGERLPAISNVVDIGNWCSCEFQLPYGLYDAAPIDGGIRLRLGDDAESYPGIRKEVVHVAGRLVVADASGPFGNPTSDSARTQVTDATRRLLVVIYAPADVEEAHVGHAVEATSARLEAFADARFESPLEVTCG